MMTWSALALYVAAAIVMTWPVVTGMTRHLPADLLDPAFVTFVIAWGSRNWLELLGGDLSAAVRFWNAPMYYPETLTTGYSEHFALHSLLTLPLFAFTRNAVLCYNVWFIGSYTLAGFFMFLLVRDLTPRLRSERAGYPLGALVAGLASDSRPTASRCCPTCRCCRRSGCRWLCSAFVRYFERGRLRSLAGAGPRSSHNRWRAGTTLCSSVRLSAFLRSSK